MKKNYVYIVAPIVALLVFTGVYIKYSSSYDDRMIEMHRKETEATQKKLDEDAKNREIAAKAAFASQEKRKAEKKAKDEKDARDKDAREAAQQAARKAQVEARRLADRVRALTKDIDVEKKEIAKIEDDRKGLVTEEAFQREYVKQAEANVLSLTANLDKFNEVDKQWEAAAKEAAKAAAAAKK